MLFRLKCLFLQIAYVNDGILIYYQPYVAGCGAEGQYNIIIKNSDKVLN